MKDRNGTEVAVYLMDIQGWHKSNVEDKAKLFSLGSFLSSIIVLRMKNIDEKFFQYLKNFFFNAKIIYERINEQPFQKLIMHFRD